MRALIVMLVVASFLGPGARQADAQRIEDGKLSGKIVSAGVELTGVGSSTILAVPSSGRFILTQICTNLRGASFAASVTGPLVRSWTEGLTPTGTTVTLIPSCTTYEPGLALVQGETLSCTGGGGTRCTISGVLSDR